MEPYSVLMSVYQKEKPAHLRSALQSLLWQTIPPEEILLVCDGPLTEDLDRVIEEFLILQPALLRTLRLPRNQGLGAALNAGLARCKNELVARMDSDDVSMPERMERQLERMEACSDISVLGGQIMEFREDVENLMGCRNVPEADAEIRKFLKKRNPMNHVTVMFRKSHILEAGGYPEFSGPGFEDYYLWAKLLARGRKLENIPQICCRVRVNEGQYSRRGGWPFSPMPERSSSFCCRLGKSTSWNTFEI